MIDVVKVGKLFPVDKISSLDHPSDNRYIACIVYSGDVYVCSHRPRRCSGIRITLAFVCVLMMFVT